MHARIAGRAHKESACRPREELEAAPRRVCWDSMARACAHKESACRPREELEAALRRLCSDSRCFDLLRMYGELALSLRGPALAPLQVFDVRLQVTHGALELACPRRELVDGRLEAALELPYFLTEGFDAALESLELGSDVARVLGHCVADQHSLYAVLADQHSLYAVLTAMV